MPHLLFSRGNNFFFRIILKSTSTKIGRSPESDVVLSDPEISREHAAVFLIEGQYFIKKLGQASVRVNGNEVQSQVLRGGEKISLGPWVAEFELSDVAPAPEEETVVTQPGVVQSQTVAISSRGIVSQNLYLHIQQPGKKLEIYPIRSEVITLGAADKNDIMLDDPYISSRHLKIIYQQGKLQVLDVGSTNGTYVNGVKVREAELEEGATIKVGNCQISLAHEDKIEAPAGPVKTEKFFGLVGKSKPMQELYGLLQRIGPTEATALILGESGTGKELVANAIHRLSSRTKGPFIAINCGAISPELIESELFGHEKGSFTGAQQQHEGAVGQAKGGTLFLDEIGELPLELQPKLLRVLENRSYRRVGGKEEIRADIRVIAATHRDLAKAVQEKKFREDLFFRLFVLPIVLKPLRERKEDIPILCAEFLKEFSINAQAKDLSPEALKKLVDHSFYGNVRELKNVLMRAFILSSGDKIQPQDLMFSDGLSAPETPKPVEEASLEKLEDMERRLVLRTLVAHRWNKSKAAEALGVAKSTLFAKIKLYNLVEAEEETA